LAVLREQRRRKGLRFVRNKSKGKRFSLKKKKKTKKEFVEHHVDHDEHHH